MKLIELLNDLFDGRDMSPSEFGKDVVKRMTAYYELNVLNSEALNNVKDRLIECDEIKNVENFDIIEIPAVEDSTGKVVACKSYKFNGDLKFGNRSYIYSIARSHESKSYIIRGIFDEISINGEIYTDQFDTLNLDYNNQNFFIVYYLDTTDVSDGTVRMTLQMRHFPKQMKEKFLERFPNMAAMSKEMLDEFEKTFESDNQ